MKQNINTEIGRAGNFKCLARDGVNQRKLHRAELVLRRMILRRQIGGFCREVARVAKQRMADVRHVYAQLVRASRDGEEPNERDIAKGRFHPIARHGALAAGQNRAGEAVRRDAINRRVDHAFGFRQNAADQRKVFLAKGIRLHLPLDMRLHIRQFGK